MSYTITPSSGYAVKSVTVDGASVGAVTAYTFSNVSANHTISATFEADEAATTSYSITASSGYGGSISPDGTAEVASGASQTYTFTPNTGYRVWYLLGDNRITFATGTTYTFSNVDASHSIKVVFTRTFWSWWRR
jgi:hypothetical protein